MPSLLFHQGQTACFLRCLYPCLWACGPAAGKWCLQTLSYFWYLLTCPRVLWVKKCFPLGSIPCQRANSRQRWFVLSPTSPRSGDTAIRAFQDPYQPMVVRARLALGPSSPRCSPTWQYIWRRFGSLRAGATVLYGINRPSSHLCLCRLATSLFYIPLDHGKFLIREFPFESVNKFHRLLPRSSLSRHRDCIFQLVHLTPQIIDVFLRSVWERTSTMTPIVLAIRNSIKTIHSPPGR